MLAKIGVGAVIVVIVAVLMMGLGRLYTPSGDAVVLQDEAGEDEYTMVTLLPPDRIPSIDHPRFVQGEEADNQYGADELVLGVEIDGEARAYSIPFLSGHEIVNDEIQGTPIAVTW